MLGAEKCFLQQLDSVGVEEVQLMRTVSTFKCIAGPATKWASTPEPNPPKPRRSTAGHICHGPMELQNLIKSLKTEISPTKSKQNIVFIQM